MPERETDVTDSAQMNDDDDNDIKKRRANNVANVAGARNFKRRRRKAEYQLATHSAMKYILWMEDDPYL